MAFEFLRWELVTVLHVNLRDEKHGEDTVSAIDIKLQVDISNERLDDLIHPDMRDAFYFNRDFDASQLKIEEVPEKYPNLRFPKMVMPLAWKDEITGARVLFDYGLGEERDSNIDLHSCKVKNFRLTLCEGGTVEVVFTVQNNEIPDGVLDKLRRKLRQQLPILVIPMGATCDLVKAPAEKKVPPKEQPPRPNSNKVINFPTPSDAAPDEPPAIDPVQLTITQAMEAAPTVTKSDTPAPKARGARSTPANLE